MLKTLECTRELEVEIKLHINKSLYEMGLITEKMYTRAKEIILKGLTNVS